MLDAANTDAARAETLRGLLSRFWAQRSERRLDAITLAIEDRFDGLTVGRNGIRRGCNSHIHVQGNSSRSAAKPLSPDVPNNNACPPAAGCSRLRCLEPGYSRPGLNGEDRRHRQAPRRWPEVVRSPHLSANLARQSDRRTGCTRRAITATNGETRDGTAEHLRECTPPAALLPSSGPS